MFNQYFYSIYEEDKSNSYNKEQVMILSLTQQGRVIDREMVSMVKKKSPTIYIFHSTQV